MLAAKTTVVARRTVRNLEPIMYDLVLQLLYTAYSSLAPDSARHTRSATAAAALASVFTTSQGDTAGVLSGSGYLDSTADDEMRDSATAIDLDNPTAWMSLDEPEGSHHLKPSKESFRSSENNRNSKKRSRGGKSLLDTMANNADFDFWEDGSGTPVTLYRYCRSYF